MTGGTLTGTLNGTTINITGNISATNFVINNNTNHGLLINGGTIAQAAGSGAWFNNSLTSDFCIRSTSGNIDIGYYNSSTLPNTTLVLDTSGNTNVKNKLLVTSSTTLSGTLSVSGTSIFSSMTTFNNIVNLNSTVFIADTKNLYIGTASTISSIDGSDIVKLIGNSNYWAITQTTSIKARTYSSTDLTIVGGLEVGGTLYANSIVANNTTTKYLLYGSSSSVAQWIVQTSACGYATIWGYTPSYIYLTNGTVDGQTIIIKNALSTTNAGLVVSSSGTTYVLYSGLVTIPWGQSTTFVWNASTSKWY